MTTLSTDVRNTLESVRERIENAIGRLLPDHDRDREEPHPSESSLARPHFGGPAIDMEETADAFIVKAEIPGMRPGDFSVEASRNRLIVRGTKEEEHEENAKGFHRMERRYGSFLRMINLPAEIDPNAVTAGYRDGVLHLMLPKTEQSRARHIRIEAPTT